MDGLLESGDLNSAVIHCMFAHPENLPSPYQKDLGCLISCSILGDVFIKVFQLSS